MRTPPPMPTATPPDVPALLAGRRRILVTGGGGFNCCAEAKGYGGAVGRRLLTDSEALVFNLDTCCYASDLTSIEQVLAELGERASTPKGKSRHRLFRVDLTDAEATADALRQADPDLVLHLAGESHVDRSIEGPGAYGSTSSPDCVNITSNVMAPSTCSRRYAAIGKRCRPNARRPSASTTSPPMKCSAPWAPRAASRKPPPTTHAAPIRPARRPATTW